MIKRLGTSAALVLLAACAGSSAGNVRLTAQEERILRPLADPPDRVRRFVEEGDQLFLKGIPPLRRSDPETGADWASEVATALDLYKRARTAYLTAQSEYASPQPVPPPLMDRINETVMRIAQLERRKHSIPR